MTASSPSLDSCRYTPGHVLGQKYVLAHMLGVGGMGIVWLARDRVLNVDVALKVIPRPDGDAHEFTLRALSEARLAARLSHPAVCRAMDFGFTDQGDAFVVSELLEGESLEEVLAREGRLPGTRAVQTLLPILDALGEAHDAGIIHRDVKPANLFLARQGSQRVQPKLLDFGIALWTQQKTRTTLSGNVLGTPDYMSPEQARGESDVDARSDLWSFCATLYESVTGVPAFEGENYNAVLWAVQSKDPTPITEFRAGDAALWAIIARGMRREREARFGSAAELSAKLADWLLSHGVETDLSGHSLAARVRDCGEVGRVRVRTTARRTPRPKEIMLAQTVASERVFGTASMASPFAYAKWGWVGASAGVLMAALGHFELLPANMVSSFQGFVEPVTARFGTEKAKPAPQALTPLRPHPTRLAAVIEPPLTPSIEATEVADPAAAPNAPPAAPAAPARATPPATRREARNTPAADVERVADSDAAPARVSESVTPARTTNALGYDFGL